MLFCCRRGWAAGGQRFFMYSFVAKYNCSSTTLATASFVIWKVEVCHQYTKSFFILLINNIIRVVVHENSIIIVHENTENNMCCCACSFVHMKKWFCWSLLPIFILLHIFLTVSAANWGGAWYFPSPLLQKYFKWRHWYFVTNDTMHCRILHNWRNCLILSAANWGGAWYFKACGDEEKSQSLFDLQRCAGVTATVDWSGLIFVRSDRSILRKKSSHAHCCKSISIGGIDISSTMIPCSVKVRTVGGIVDKPRMFLLWCNVEASNNSGGSKSSSSAAIL